MESCSSSFHVAFLAVPFGSHASVLFSLARHLATSLPSGTFSFFSTARSNSGLVRYNNLWPTNLRSYDVHDGLPDGALQLSPLEEIDLFLGLVPGNFSERMMAVEEESGRITCVVSDGFWGFAGDLAVERGALWVSYWNSAPTALLAHLCTDLLRQSAGTEGDRARAQEALDSIPGFSSLCIEDLPEGIVLSDTTSSLALQLHHMSQMITNAAAVVLNSFEGLDPTLDTQFQTKFKRCHNIMPFSLLSSKLSEVNDKHCCLAWLDSQVAGSVVYISFGSSALPPKEELVEIAEGLQASGTPFLWSLKEIAWGHLPDDFLDYVASRGLIVPWAPQPQVLEHSAVGAFLTHSGWNSVLESITTGVPMILRPFFGDQHFKCEGRFRCLENWSGF
ncbi:flavonol 3-O-glucosyltransferase-like [Dioscorea cayenensis subsp. rotundata]|uniref:Flavonol 3-O-glucosyltransferase-like n=1 Tax=Dioscorea cayennensis subsp. rotundata TaxID=55577 RepID=A0AB40CPY3_DIOCR|nr:flavonol 3-O-glucosyltransferase-like [Dioscorea cayenensis subsp. rotundata]